MDALAAWARLKAMTDADSAPVLSADDLSALLSLAALADTAGNAPSVSGWTPTYDLHRAAAEGWRWKAARLVGAYDFTADGATYQRSQMLAHCERMIAQYARKVVSYVGVQAPLAQGGTDGS